MTLGIPKSTAIVYHSSYSVIGGTEENALSQVWPSDVGKYGPRFL
jgi:hypothetical protein